MNSEMEGVLRSYCPLCKKRLITYRAEKDSWKRVYHRECWRFEQSRREKQMILDYHRRIYEEEQMLDKDIPD